MTNTIHLQLKITINIEYMKKIFLIIITAGILGNVFARNEEINKDSVINTQKLHNFPIALDQNKEIEGDRKSVV